MRVSLLITKVTMNVVSLDGRPLYVIILYNCSLFMRFIHGFIVIFKINPTAHTGDGFLPLLDIFGNSKLLVV